MDDVAIKVDNVSKVFKLPHEKQNSIKSHVVNVGRRRKGYELQQALNDVSFEVKKGEFFGIVGRNGSGKSTLLKLLAGIYKPTSGGIGVNGTIVPFIELGVGFNPELTGRENVFLNGALLGFNRKEMNAMYQDIVDFAELEKFMDQRLKNYSSGMQVRLAFSIAIRAQGDILLLDEVLAVGDAAFQEKCFDYFGKLKKEGRTVILVTHDMQSVTRFCTRAILIDNGVIMMDGKAVEVAQQYTKDNFSGASPTEIAEKFKSSKASDVRIQKFVINGHKSTNQGETIKVSVTINSKLKTEVVLGLTVLENMYYVGGANSSKDLEGYKLRVGENVIDCEVQTSSIGAGNYNFGCTLLGTPGYKVLDQTVDGPKFQVTTTETHKDGVANIEVKFKTN